MLAVGGTLGVYTVSVATHLGEFWPFSIFPMFSQAGKPWVRALMVDITDAAEPPGWGPYTLTDLPGVPYAGRSVGVSANDLAKFAKLTDNWTEERIKALRELYASPLAERRELMLLRARGRFEQGADGKSVVISLEGVIRLRQAGEQLNPDLEQKA